MAAEGRNRAVGKRFTVADVRRAYSPEKALDERFNQWPVYYGPRILSFYLTPSLLNAGLGPATVTVWALLLALALPWLALAPLPWAIWGVAVGGALFIFLDCLDGDMARTAGRVSERGAYLDFIADLIFRQMFCLALGLLVQAEATGGPWLVAHGPVIGLGAAAFSSVARCCRLHSERQSDDNEIYARHLEGKYGLFDRIFFFFCGLEFLLPVLVIIFGLWQHLYLVLSGVFFYFMLDFVVTQYFVWRKL